MFRPEPTTHIHQLLLVYFSRIRQQFVLALGLKVTLEMIKQAHLFLQLIRIILETAFLYNVFSFNSLDIIEKIFVASKHLGRVVEVDPDHIIGQRIADTVLRGVVDPFSDCRPCRVKLGLTRSLLIIAPAAILQDALTLCPSDIFRYFLFGRFIDGAGPIRGQESILTLLA